MNILVGKTFGIGNACLSVPLIKALRSLGHQVDVLIGQGPDDHGALEVFMYFMENHGFSPKSLYTDQVPEGVNHDLAIMAIPFDGRWQNGVHYRAQIVLDERKRPDNVERLGFDMWKRHEVEYQMDSARYLGFESETPDGQIDEAIFKYPRDTDLVYLGVGYKRDPGGFGLSKHFGNERYFQLMRAIRKIRPTTTFVSTCGVADWIQTGVALKKRTFEDNPMAGSYYGCKVTSVTEAIQRVRTCTAYLGNDTGMMHVAAALGLPTLGLFAYPDLLVKNPPYTARGRALLFAPECPPIEDIARQFVDFVCG